MEGGREVGFVTSPPPPGTAGRVAASGVLNALVLARGQQLLGGRSDQGGGVLVLVRNLAPGAAARPALAVPELPQARRAR